ncbi:MAG TPA: phosphatase PAP2 family protein [Pirellulaceae bacterium]|nr:phosphatase PAP2 family protein [Pirellulaceae bacterium]HMO92445.1 phosphatase PAP2 family protein [Pirellulaceae bacterium]HMP67885.1 phosphatase PAP2 family protein [Pirellulaceae bacterium]
MLQQKRASSRRYLVSIGVLVVLGVIISLFDGVIARDLNYHNLPGEIRRVLSWAEVLGHGLGLATIMVGIYAFAPSFRKFLPRIAACTICGGLLGDAVKLVVERVRPVAVYHQLDDIAGHALSGWGETPDMHASAVTSYHLGSFPSSHAATAFAFAAVMVWLIPRSGWYFYTLAALAGIQRVAYLGHWTSDVVVGAVIGLLMGMLFTQTKFANRIFARLEQRSNWKAILLHQDDANRRRQKNEAATEKSEHRSRSVQRRNPRKKLEYNRAA